MARKKKDVYHVGPLTEGKKNIIAALMDEYEIETADDIQEALKDLLGGTIKSMMEAEMTDHLGYEKSERSDSDNYRNGTKTKTVRSKYGEFEVDVPKDRNGTFEPQVVKNRQKDISGIDDKIISMYARGLTTRQISDQIEEIYGFECSESFISDVTDKILKDIEEWQHRPLDSVYPIVFIDACHFSVRDNGLVRKLAAYVMLGINSEGRKDIISLSIGENESAKYWLGVLNELKNRGVRDIMIICADGLTGIKEAISSAFPKTEYQRCASAYLTPDKLVCYFVIECGCVKKSSYVVRELVDVDFHCYFLHIINILLKQTCPNTISVSTENAQAEFACTVRGNAGIHSFIR